MGRKTFRPISQQFGEREIYRDQNDFSSGMFHDPPHSEIPEQSIAYLKNQICFPRWLEGRNGAPIHSTTPYPSLDGRTDYTLTQAGNTVTSGSGNIFSEADISNYIVWDDGTHTEITGYTSATVVTVGGASANRTSTNAYLRGRRNAELWHYGQEYVLMQLGNDVYYSTWELDSFTKIYCISYDSPNNVDGTLDEIDERSAVLINSAGTFRIVLDVAVPYMYRMNTEVPNIRVTTNDKSLFNTVGRRYLYSATRMRGEVNFRSRTVEGVLIEQESGTNAVDSEYDDYGEVWGSVPIGNNTKTTGQLVGNTVLDINLNVNGVWGVITDGSFTVDINTETVVVFVDFTAVTTMNEVAERIQEALRAFSPDATCKFIADHFELTAGYISGNSMGYMVDGDPSGTNIADLMRCRLADGAVLDNAYIFEQNRLIEGFTVPVQSVNPTDPEWHWNTFSIYGTMDIGPEGTDPVTGVGNNTELFVWLYDLRMAGAFLAEKTDGGVVTATFGEFEEADVGSVLEWENGSRDIITQYIDSVTVIAGTAEGAYYGGAKTLQAVAIGNGTVMRASQAGNTVTNETALNANVFSADDVGKTIIWSTGEMSYIIAYVDPDTVTVHDSATRSVRGITKDWRYRNFNDTVSDTVLRARAQSGEFKLRQRFWRPLPLANIGAVTPGFLFTAARNDKKIYYSQIGVGLKYLMGYHNPQFHFDESIKEALTVIFEFSNRVVAFTKSRWYAGPTNVSSEVTIPEVGEVLAVFNGFQIGGNVGVSDYGGIVRTDQLDEAFIFTNEPAIRIFNGYEFGPNLLEDSKSGMRIAMDEIESWQPAVGMAYHPNSGFIVWGKR